jgi:hypothetical protein
MTLWLPLVHLHRTRHWCLPSCASIDVTQDIDLTLGERGAGDAPDLPERLPMSGIPSLGVYAPAGTTEKPATLIADKPFYVAVVDVWSQVVLADALVERPTL